MSILKSEITPAFHIRPLTAISFFLSILLTQSNQVANDWMSPPSQSQPIISENQIMRLVAALLPLHRPWWALLSCSSILFNTGIRLTTIWAGLAPRIFLNTQLFKVLSLQDQDHYIRVWLWKVINRSSPHHFTGLVPCTVMGLSALQVVVA